MPTARSQYLKDSLRKAVTLWHWQQIKERGALPMIDRGDIRQQLDRCSNIWAFTAGRWLWSVWSIRLTARLQNSKKRAEWSGEIDVLSRVTAIISALVICDHRLPVIAAVNHYRDNAITYKAQRQKCQRTEGERGNYRITQTRQR